MSARRSLTGGVSGIRRTIGPLSEVLETLGRLGITPGRYRRYVAIE